MTNTIDQGLRMQFRRFVADEGGAIAQLRQFASGQLGGHLDTSVGSLTLLDAFIANLTRQPQWDLSPLFTPYSSDVKSWLAVRVAYYFAACLRSHVGGDWRLSERDGSPFLGMPVFDIRGNEVSPLEIAFSSLEGTLTGGLSAVASAIERNVGLG